MTYGKGFATVAAVKRATVWGTPVACGAGNQIEFTSEGLTPDSQFIEDNQLSGPATTLFGDKGNEFHSGPIDMDMKYEGNELLLALAMGTAGVPTQVGADNAYLHVFKIATDKQGKFATVAFNKQVGVWEYTTCKVGGFTLAIKNGERMKATYPLIPQGLNINTSSGTNNSTTMGTVTLPTNREFVRFSQVIAKINDSAGGALANADLIYISDFEVSLDNAFPTDDVTTQFGYLIDEPIQDGFTKVTGKISFSKYHDTAPGGNSTLISNLLSKTRKKMTIEATGSAIGATAFRLSFFFPDLQFTTGDANVGGPGRIPVNLNFMASRRTAAPTGFTAGHTDPVVIELVNQTATDILA